MSVSNLYRQPGEKFHDWARRAEIYQGRISALYYDCHRGENFHNFARRVQVELYQGTMSTSYLNRQPGERFHNWARRVQIEYNCMRICPGWRGIHERCYPNSIVMVKKFIQEINSCFENCTLRKIAIIKIQRTILQWLYRPGGSFMKKAEIHFYKTALTVR